MNLAGFDLRMPAFNLYRPSFFDPGFRIKAGNERLYQQRPFGCRELQRFRLYSFNMNSHSSSMNCYGMLCVIQF